MSTDYEQLAPLYSLLGMNNFAIAETKNILDFAQRNDWFGRQILDVGFGTGESLLWLAQRGYIVSGIDASPAMLNITKQKFEASELSAKLSLQDIRNYNMVPSFDMILALDVLNELDSVKDIEVVFKNVSEALKSDKWFIFDLHTIEGLFMMQEQGEKIILENKTHTVITQPQFDYDRQVLTMRYLAFLAQENAWQRIEAKRILKSYPIQAISALLQRYNFTIQHVLTTRLQKYEPLKSGTTRVIIVAQKR
jgi:2-polyprenyl-3-methyl-5-hydroxy-6-metoxy-1,4-benzoquinol methylase